MHKTKEDIRQIVEPPLIGVGVVLLTLGCILLALWGLIIITRVVAAL